jgi:hypothetical protein
VNRQDARDAKGWDEPGREVDAVAASVVEAAVEVTRLRLALVINFNVPVLLRGIPL